MTNSQSPSLLELAARCEAATGPDTDLSHDIGRALAGHSGYRYQPYTASLDAAMTLVPEGWAWLVEGDGTAILEHSLETRMPLARANAMTPALALCAAALRGRNTQ